MQLEESAQLSSIMLIGFIALLTVLALIGGIVLFEGKSIGQNPTSFIILGSLVLLQSVWIYRVSARCKATAQQIQQLDKKLNILNKRLKELNENQ